MTVKYHISKKGVPSICRAQKGNCPLGGNENHYNTKEEAQKVVDKMNEENHGLIQGLKSSPDEIVRKADNTEKRRELRERMEAVEEREKAFATKSYYQKCHQVTRLNDYKPSVKETGHYSEDRRIKEEMIQDMFGEAKLVGHFKVKHEVNWNNVKNQIISIYDSGQIKIYDVNHGGLVTTFIPHKTRVEAMLLKAGEIPDEEWLEQVQRNKEALDEEWDKKMEGTGEKKNSQFNKKPPLKTDVKNVTLPPADTLNDSAQKKPIPTERVERPKPQRNKPKQQKKNNSDNSGKPKKTEFKRDIVDDFFRKNRKKGPKKYY